MQKKKTLIIVFIAIAMIIAISYWWKGIWFYKIPFIIVCIVAVVTILKYKTLRRNINSNDLTLISVIVAILIFVLQSLQSITLTITEIEKHNAYNCEIASYLEDAINSDTQKNHSTIKKSRYYTAYYKSNMNVAFYKNDSFFKAINKMDISNGLLDVVSELRSRSIDSFINSEFENKIPNVNSYDQMIKGLEDGVKDLTKDIKHVVCL
ncbi:MAG: hypothetical protein WC875_05690 [Candidatus Absconditabacterales bacterium]